MKICMPVKTPQKGSIHKRGNPQKTAKFAYILQKRLKWLSATVSDMCACMYAVVFIILQHTGIHMYTYPHTYVTKRGGIL